MRKLLYFSLVLLLFPLALLVGGVELLQGAEKEFAHRFVQEFRTGNAVVKELILSSPERFKKNLSVITANLLKLQYVNVSGNYHTEESDILKATAIAKGNWVWKTAFGEIDQKLDNLPWIKSNALSLSLFPAALSVSVDEADPWLVAEFKGDSWLVSDQGTLIQTLSSLRNSDLILESSELPRLDGLDANSSSPSFLSSANQRFTYATRMLRFLQMAGSTPFSIERISLLPQGALKIYPADFSRYPRILVSVNSLSEAHQVTARLRAVLSDVQSRGEEVREIDLRFKNQAVVR